MKPCVGIYSASYVYLRFLSNLKCVCVCLMATCSRPHVHLHIRTHTHPPVEGGGHSFTLLLPPGVGLHNTPETTPPGHTPSVASQGAESWSGLKVKVQLSQLSGIPSLSRSTPSHTPTARQMIPSFVVPSGHRPHSAGYRSHDSGETEP